MNREIVWTAQFKKDYKLAIKQHLDIDLLDDVIRILARGDALPQKKQGSPVIRRLGRLS